LKPTIVLYKTEGISGNEKNFDNSKTKEHRDRFEKIILGKEILILFMSYIPDFEK